MAISIERGVKQDQGKPRLDLMPTEALEEIGKVLEFGAKKYDPWNWAKGLAWSRLLGAALRHLYAWARGESKDPESGLSHLAHAGCNILFLIYFERNKSGEDDRHLRSKKNESSI